MRASSGMIARHQAADAAPPALAGIVAEPDPGRGDADRQAVRDRPARDRSSAGTARRRQAPTAGAPARSRGPPPAPSSCRRRRCGTARPARRRTRARRRPRPARPPRSARPPRWRQPGRRVPRPAPTSWSDRRCRRDAARTGHASRRRNSARFGDRAWRTPPPRPETRARRSRAGRRAPRAGPPGLSWYPPAVRSCLNLQKLRRRCAARRRARPAHRAQRPPRPGTASRGGAARPARRRPSRAAPG